MIVRDNGSGSGDAPAAPAAAPPPAAGQAETGLREGEKEMLRNIHAQEEADAQRRHEKALQSERAEVAKEAIRAEKEYQAQLRVQHCAQYPTSKLCR